MQIHARIPGLYLAVLLVVISGRFPWGPKTEELIVGKVHERVAQARGGDRKTEARKLRVIVFGAHPDDPESGCGGLIALLTREGHEVIVAYATCFRGDRKIGDESEAVVRRREASAA